MRTLEAAFALLCDDRSASYWVTGSSPGPAMTVLLGSVFPLLEAQGLESFDWIGANTPSIAEFKRRFGAMLTPYFRIEKVVPRLPRLLLALRNAS